MLESVKLQRLKNEEDCRALTLRSNGFFSVRSIAHNLFKGENNFEDHLYSDISKETCPEQVEVFDWTACLESSAEGCDIVSASDRSVVSLDTASICYSEIQASIR